MSPSVCVCVCLCVSVGLCVFTCVSICVFNVCLFGWIICLCVTVCLCVYFCVSACVRVHTRKHHVEWSSEGEAYRSMAICQKPGFDTGTQLSSPLW